ncbi:hypothetical protein L207DRAFT_138175 [Hyaloscypha variabilis F]|uniref:Uncharacterized protein n=1 Tax=Hyaloscypha variabilis (strain UAMH 11265 / GT02V1 / F) TaxID=1149755 RepID=A0A2J6R6X3_HYAVF|nr:hypothetical protein L207DRAFT_138175 [Hyaloscypha variabilis F]
MDPFSALSVAANIVQFIVYGINIVSKGNQLYKSTDGALIENVELQEATIRLQQLSRNFDKSLDQSLSQGLSAQNDESIQKICGECKAVSKELVEKLERLKVPEGHPHKKWKSFRQALKSVWTKERIEDIAQRLSQLRIELDSHVLVSLREQVTIMSIQQNARFTSLENESKKIMFALLANNEALLAGIESNFRNLNLSSQSEHAKTREILHAHTEANHRRKAELHILESLRFETMKYRYETISEAHKRTFEWIFRDPDAEGKPWSSFIKWAESGSGIYWINGKAGSGKSTLMRFIVDDPQTQSHLQQWAPRENLITPAFFFWNSGVPEQRSQAGLLRSIIYEALQKHTHLFPLVFPEEWPKILELSRHEVSPISEVWSSSRLRKAFRRLLGCSSKEFRFCFFIDGLDEYDGDHEEIANYFSDISSLPYIKFCIASRPLTVFKDTFSMSSALRLQDLTSHDIEIYVKDKLNGHNRMKVLTAKDPRRSNDLVQELIAKAAGVFLWVTLVVTSLLKGLGQRDGFPQLLERLDSFPSELGHLYGHMLNLIDPIYMAEGARLFRTYKLHTNMLRPVTAEELYITHIVDLPRVLGTTSDDLQRARNEEVELLNSNFLDNHEFSIYDCQSLLEHMDYLLWTRCGGLLEINKGEHLREPSIHYEGTVEYLHRTAREYLDREDVWEAICRHETDGITFEPALQLLMCQVLRLKRLSISEITGLERTSRAIHHFWLEVCLICRVHNLVTIDSLKIRRRLLYEFDYQATNFFGKANVLSPENPELQHSSSYGFPSNWQSDFLCETIRYGLQFYVEAQYCPTKDF